MAQLEIGAYIGATQIEITVFHAQIVAAISVFFDGEGGDFTGVEYGEFVDDDLDVAGVHFVVLGVALIHVALYLNHEFAAEFVGLGAKFCIGFFVEYELGDAITIAEVDKSHTAHFARALHPSGEGDTLANFAQAEFATIVGSIHIACANFCSSCVEFRKSRWAKMQVVHLLLSQRQSGSDK